MKKRNIKEIVIQELTYLGIILLIVGIVALGLIFGGV